MSRRSHDYLSPLMRWHMAIGIDQARFAFLVSLTPNVLSKIERGVREPSPNEAQRIDAALSELESRPCTRALPHRRATGQLDGGSGHAPDMQRPPQALGKPRGAKTRQRRHHQYNSYPSGVCKP